MYSEHKIQQYYYTQIDNTEERMCHYRCGCELDTGSALTH